MKRSHYDEPHADARAVRARLTQAFRALRKSGYVCRQNFMCCMGCANAAMPEGTTKCVFYHRQDADSLRKRGSVYLAWTGDGPEIFRAMEAAGLRVDWNGSDDERMKVSMPKT